MNNKLSNEFKKNVYLKPDEYLNGWAKKCGWKATIVYDSLWRHADREKRCFPSIELMAEEHGVSRSTIIRGLKILIGYNLVTKKDQRNKKGRFLHNIYTLTNKNKWKDISKFPTGTRLSKFPTDTIQVPHRNTKDTHIKDTHNIKKEIYKERKEEILKTFNRENKTNYKTTVSFEANLDFWLTQYSLEEIKEAISNIPNNPYWCDKMTPTILFRRKNPAKESVDYIGDLLNSREGKKETDNGFNPNVKGDNPSWL